MITTTNPQMSKTSLPAEVEGKGVANHYPTLKTNSKKQLASRVLPCARTRKNLDPADNLERIPGLGTVGAVLKAMTAETAVKLQNQVEAEGLAKDLSADDSKTKQLGGHAHKLGSRSSV